MDTKVEIKEESYFSDFYSLNERGLFTKDLVKNIKSETVTSDSHCDVNTKPETEGAALVYFCEQNERESSSEVPIMGFNKSRKDSEIETNVEIKAGEWWREQTSTETLYIYNDFKDTTDDVYLTKSPCLYKDGVSSFKSGLFSNEALGNYISITMRNNSSEYERERNYQSLESVESDAIRIFSLETNACSEKPNVGNIGSLTSSFIQTGLLQQSNTNKQQISNNCRSILNRDIMSVEFNKCDICEKYFNQLSDLKRHKLTHNSKKPHNNSICDKDFTQFSTLKIPNWIHECKKPLKCDFCDKGFTDLSNLINHKLIDEDKNAYKCNICNNIFVSSSHLKRHKLIHVHKKPIKCSICEKTFTRQGTLKVHKLIHEGRRPHKCKICDKAFTDASNFRVHKLLHEGKKPHQCNFCDKAFIQKSQLKRHQLTHEKLVTSVTLI